MQTDPAYPYTLLPDGVHLCDEGAFRERFVDRLADEVMRKEICDGFFRLRAEAVGHGISARQWVDGSFVTGKPNPGDIDVVTFCDYGFLNNLGAPERLFAVQCLKGGEATKATYRTHTFLVASCAVGHPYHDTFEAARAYWRKWFGDTNPKEIPNPPGPYLPGRIKGFVQMVLGDVNLAPIIATERGTP